tara:strand:- start:256 stop:624 length:369 start_codon:yes stop_codon:yes gene_type:complete
MILKGESAEEFNRKADENYEKFKARQKQNTEIIEQQQTKTKMSKVIKSQKMIKEGLWTIELMDGTIIQCTNNDDFKIINQNKDERIETTSAYERVSVIARMKDKTSTGLTRDDLLNQNKEDE